MTDMEVIDKLNAELKEVTFLLKLYKHNGRACEKLERRKFVIFLLFFYFSSKQRTMCFFKKNYLIIELESRHNKKKHLVYRHCKTKVP